MTSTFRVRHSGNSSPASIDIAGTSADTDENNNLAIWNGDNAVALFKREAWDFVTKEEPPALRVVSVRLPDIWIPPHLIERHIELII